MVQGCLLGTNLVGDNIRYDTRGGLPAAGWKYSGLDRAARQEADKN